MASNITLTELIDACKDRSDMQNSRFITDTEWTRYVNQASKELYDILISKGLDYTTTKQTLTVNGTDDTFNLPSDFYKLVGVDYKIGGMTKPMMQFQFLDRNRNEAYNSLVMYRLVGADKIMFTPTPSAQDLTIWYVPVLAKLTTGSDNLNGVHGWEEYVIVRSSIWALQKEESDTSDLKQDLMFLKNRIEEMASNRDQGMPARVTDAKKDSYRIAWDTL